MLHTEYSLPSTVGDSVLMVLNMLVSTKNRVTNNPILPGTTEGEMRKLTQETWKTEIDFDFFYLFVPLTITNSPEGK